jgi:hypothetical protein
MARRKTPTAVEQLVNAYAVVLPLLPTIGRAVQAEREAPGYGAKAVAFDLMEAMQRFYELEQGCEAGKASEPPA